MTVVSIVGYTLRRSLEGYWGFLAEPQTLGGEPVLKVS